MEAIKVYGSINDLGDGTANIRWFTTSEQAEWHIYQYCEGSMLEEPIVIDTFKGSETHTDALGTSNYFKSKYEQFLKEQNE